MPLFLSLAWGSIVFWGGGEWGLGGGAPTAEAASLADGAITFGTPRQRARARSERERGGEAGGGGGESNHKAVPEVALCLFDPRVTMEGRRR